MGTLGPTPSHYNFGNNTFKMVTESEMSFSEGWLGGGGQSHSQPPTSHVSPKFKSPCETLLLDTFLTVTLVP